MQNAVDSWKSTHRWNTLQEGGWALFQEFHINHEQSAMFAWATIEQLNERWDLQLKKDWRGPRGAQLNKSEAKKLAKSRATNSQINKLGN